MVISFWGGGIKARCTGCLCLSSAFMFVIYRKRNRCYRMPHVTLKIHRSVIFLHINTTRLEGDKSTGIEEHTVRYRKRSVTHTDACEALSDNMAPYCWACGEIRR